MQPEIKDQILRRLDAYDGSLKRLRFIIAELDAIWSAEDWQPADSENMRSAWGTLEEIYAVAVNRGTIELSASDQEAIKEALVAIRRDDG
jgi:hypothetical protein